VKTDDRDEGEKALRKKLMIPLEYQEAAQE